MVMQIKLVVVVVAVVNINMVSNISVHDDPLFAIAKETDNLMIMFVRDIGSS